MQRKTLAAYTAPTSPFPPFLNMTQDEAGNVVVTLRSPPVEGVPTETGFASMSGPFASATFDRAAMREFLAEALDALA